MNFNFPSLNMDILSELNDLFDEIVKLKSLVKETQVDALAIAIGTSHGAYKFSRPPTKDILSIERIQEIHTIGTKTAFMTSLIFLRKMALHFGYL